MSGTKRCLDEHNTDERKDAAADYDSLPAKRARNSATKANDDVNRALIIQLDDEKALPTGADRLSSLSDELLIRILSYLALPCLLSLAPVSKRFRRLSDDSELWKAIYFDGHILSRGLRTPRFQNGTVKCMAQSTNAFQSPAFSDGSCAIAHQNANIKTAWRREGRKQPSNSTVADEERIPGKQRDTGVATPAALSVKTGYPLNWKQKYKLRHNWARGKCAVDELPLGGSCSTVDGNSLPMSSFSGQEQNDEDQEKTQTRGQFHRILVKVVDGMAVTADADRGLRVWDLKSRCLVTGEQLDMGDIGEGDAQSSIPTSLSVGTSSSSLDIAVGLLDGGFQIWQFHLARRRLGQCYLHPASENGATMAISYCHPYILTATDAVLISLYYFGPPPKPTPRSEAGTAKSKLRGLFRPPHLLTSLRSHSSRHPLALSIRKLASVTIASIVHTFSTRLGCSIGVQDLHIAKPGPVTETAPDAESLPFVVTTRLAYSTPMGHISRQTRQASESYPSPPTSNLRSRMHNYETTSGHSTPQTESSRLESEKQDLEGGPISLCYSHPYLLATMPDNTLMLYLCTSSPSRLSISTGIRLWGHTSGISDAEITAKGKAVSISMRGEEMRVWELEGRPEAERARSVAIRPSPDKTPHSERTENTGMSERRNWVGFDDEMVIVLKESRLGRESLMVYDFS